MPSEYSPTGGAIALSVAVVKPDSRGSLRLRSPDPREQREIDCNSWPRTGTRAGCSKG